MFNKVAIFAVATLAVFAAAKPDDSDSGIHDSCNTGPVQCCNSIQDASSTDARKEANLLGIDISKFTGQVGFHCSPLTAIGVGSGSKCGSQPVCCSNNSFNGLVAIGCSPINVNL